MDDAALVAVLRLCARIHCDAADYERLADAAKRLVDWADLPARAEAHGLAPLAYRHLARAGVAMPFDARQRLFAASVRHREANRVRFRVLGEILDEFARAAIPVIVLKGAALAHLLYPSPDLRPLSDIDLLVEAQFATRAQAVLAASGFLAPLSATSRRLVSHHHLPAALTQRDGHLVHVEIHVDALTHDTRGSLSMRRLTSAPQPFLVEGRTASALGHADMLYHLCRHTAERASLLRLIWVADVVGYAARYREEIPWDDLRRRYPFVLNALSLLHLVTPLPEELRSQVPPARGERLRGVGVACKPLSQIVQRHRPLREVGRDLFDPSDWWLRLHYGVADGRPLAWQRWIEHPVHVARWLTRRAIAAMWWWAR